MITYKCDTRNTRLVGRGIKVSYDGECCLTVECGFFQSAITAYPGETVVLHRARGQAVVAVVA